CPVGMDRTVSEQAVVGKVSRPVTVDQEGFHPEEALVDVDDGKVPPGGHFGDDAVHFSYPMDGQRRGGEGIVQVEEEKGTRVPSADHLDQLDQMTLVKLHGSGNGVRTAEKEHFQIGVKQIISANIERDQIRPPESGLEEGRKGHEKKKFSAGGSLLSTVCNPDVRQM